MTPESVLFGRRYQVDTTVVYVSDPSPVLLAPADGGRVAVTIAYNSLGDTQPTNPQVLVGILVDGVFAGVALLNVQTPMVSLDVARHGAIATGELYADAFGGNAQRVAVTTYRINGAISQ